MTKKTVGYVDLEWTCPNCGGRNPGVNKKCATCGFAQPENVQFEQSAQDTLITDTAKIEAAKSGPDIHCPYCGTRNPAGSERCKQCAGDLTGAKARESGRVVGGMRKEPAPPVKCPSCGTENPATAQKCANCGAVLAKPQPVAAAPQAAKPAGKMNPAILIAVAAIALVACIGLFLVLGRGGGGGRTEQAAGEVSDVYWRRAIAVQALLPITRQDWRDEIPSGAKIGGCQDRLFDTVDEQVPNSVEVCGTPYVVDTGTGVGEVQQDCEYQVFKEYCDYSSLGWQVAAPLVLEGRDFAPQWPETRLGKDQRESERSEQYVVTFQTENGPVRYQVPKLQDFQQFVQGSKWILDVNSRGEVIRAQPAQ